MKTQCLRLTPLSLTIALALGAALSAQAGAMEIVRASTASDGGEANDESGNWPTEDQSSLSADGTKVAFTSFADNLVQGDSNGNPDVFVKDLQTGVTTRVSTDSDGTGLEGQSYSPSLSADGTKVAFKWGPESDIFVKDLDSGLIIIANTDSNGVAGTGESNDPSLSADGTKVAFESSASNLVVGDNNGKIDIFVKELQTGVITRASTDSNGTQANAAAYSASLSADGTKVAFESSASNLLGGDSNGITDIFVKDLQTGILTRASADNNGTKASGASYGASLSADGTKVAFVSGASNLVVGDGDGVAYYDIFVKDLNTGLITRVSTASDGTEAEGNSFMTSLSADGTKVAFESWASNLVAGDSSGHQDIFVKDLQTGVTTRVSSAVDLVTDEIIEANADSSGMSPSADGTKVAFTSSASNLVTGDSNGYADVFVATNLFQPNLSAVAGAQTRACTARGCSISVAYTMANSGPVAIDTTGLFASGYLSSDAECGTVDAYVGDSAITTSPETMTPGASKQWSFIFSGRPAQLKGKYACVLIDSHSDLSESNEVDNWASWPIKLQ